jgi:hypothetical protein
MNPGPRSFLNEQANPEIACKVRVNLACIQTWPIAVLSPGHTYTYTHREATHFTFHVDLVALFRTSAYRGP